jgi:hypothetical protein
MPALPLPFARRPIRSRILVLYSIDAQVLAPLLPPGHAPRLHHGSAIAALCFTRLGSLRLFSGSQASDHLALRFAVTRDGREEPEPATWIPWRGTSSRFEVREDSFGVELTARASDGEILHLRAGASQPDRRGLFPGASDLEDFLGRQGPVEPFDPFAAEADRLEPGNGFTPEPLNVFELRLEPSVLDRELLHFDSAWRLVRTRPARLRRERVRHSARPVSGGGAIEGLPTGV